MWLAGSRWWCHCAPAELQLCICSCMGLNSGAVWGGQAVGGGGSMAMAAKSVIYEPETWKILPKETINSANVFMLRRHGLGKEGGYGSLFMIQHHTSLSGGWKRVGERRRRGPPSYRHLQPPLKNVPVAVHLQLLLLATKWCKWTWGLHANTHTQFLYCVKLSHFQQTGALNMYIPHTPTACVLVCVCFCACACVQRKTGKRSWRDVTPVMLQHLLRPHPVPSLHCFSNLPAFYFASMCVCHSDDTTLVMWLFRVDGWRRRTWRRKWLTWSRAQQEESCSMPSNMEAESRGGFWVSVWNRFCLQRWRRG